MYTYKKLTRKLDKKIKKMIKENIQNEKWDFDYIKKKQRKYESLYDLLRGSFVFMETNQGHKFWQEITEKGHKKKIILGRNIFL